MAGDDKPVAGVGLDGLRKLGLGSVADFSPGIPEAAVNIAVFAEICGATNKIEIRSLIRHGLCSSGRKHDELVGVVNSEKTCIVGPDCVLEPKGSLRPCSFS